MKAIVKHVMVVICILITIVSCKKSDFRDALVGNYYCVSHYQQNILTWNGRDSIVDSVIGNVTLMIAKSGDSGIVINGITYPSAYVDSSTIAYGAFENNGSPNTVIFYHNGDSIWYQVNDHFQVDIQDYTNYYGHKVH